MHIYGGKDRQKIAAIGTEVKMTERYSNDRGTEVDVDRGGQRGIGAHRDRDIDRVITACSPAQPHHHRRQQASHCQGRRKG